jgi:5-methylcytosine-specific restriction endonuclease McrA
MQRGGDKLLKPFFSYSGVFVEITKSEHKHGGVGWEFGTCLWSPTHNRAGHDRYSLMRTPTNGDLVFHFYNDAGGGGIVKTRLVGHSTVSDECKVVRTEPPASGDWGGFETYYRIELTDLVLYEDPIDLSTILEEYHDEIRQDLIENQPRFFPFNIHGDSIRTVQGIYLAKCTPHLYGIFIRALNLQDTLSAEEQVENNPHKVFSEARRLKAETYFFARNPRLAQKAKEYYGTRCQVCGFDFGEFYGPWGEGYIELHHLRPLSERPEEEWEEQLLTEISDVTVLCANCHRMIHRKRPALSIQELKKLLGIEG